MRVACAGRLEDKLLEGDAGAVAPGAVQEEGPLAILSAERLAGHTRAVLKEARPTQRKLLLGLAAVSVADGIDAQLVEVHHSHVGCDGRLRAGGGQEGG